MIKSNPKINSTYHVKFDYALINVFNTICEFAQELKFFITISFIITTETVNKNDVWVLLLSNYIFTLKVIRIYVSLFDYRKYIESVK